MWADLILLAIESSAVSMIYGKDFKDGIKKPPLRPSILDGRRHWIGRGALLLLGISVIGVVVAKTHESISREVVLQPEAPVIPESERVVEILPLPADTPVFQKSDSVAAQPPTQTSDWAVITVKKGDSASTIFSKLEIHRDLHPLLAIPAAQEVLNNLRPGNQIRLRKDEGGLTELYCDISKTSRLHVTREDNKLFANLLEDDIELRRMITQGEIERSLIGSGKKAGLSSNLVMQLVDIFAYDIDFALDIREGDKFKVIYEEHYANGEKLAGGDILAAEFTNRGRNYKALRFTDKRGKVRYYTPDGKSLRKAFLRTPVNFSRISSHFDPRRKHPILNTIKAHRGVDYAAPTGTPVKATGDGKIIFRGKQGGYGKAVILQHGNTYSTLYGHLSRYKKGQKSGEWVKQGEIIGYVGKTGRATGPHLHYEFRVKGAHKNPLTVKLPPANPIPRHIRVDFEEQTRALLTQLTHDNTLASANLPE